VVQDKQSRRPLSNGDEEVAFHDCLIAALRHQLHLGQTIPLSPCSLAIVPCGPVWLRFSGWAGDRGALREGKQSTHS